MAGSTADRAVASGSLMVHRDGSLNGSTIVEDPKDLHAQHWPRPTEMTQALGWIGTALVLAAYAQPDVVRLRAINLLAGAILIAFNVLVGVWPNVALEVALVAVNLARIRHAAGDSLSHDQSSAPVVRRVDRRGTPR